MPHLHPLGYYPAALLTILIAKLIPLKPKEAKREIEDPIMHDAIVATVNHDGDSDSTGSITGNIMGAIYGYDAIKKEQLFCPKGKEFEQTIELSNIILALADDIFNGCCIGEYSKIDTPAQKQWYARYVDMKPAGINE